MLGVCLVTGAYYPEVSGGGLQARTLALALRSRVRCTVVTTTTDPSLPARDTIEGIPVRRVFLDPASPASKLAAGIRMARHLLALRGEIDLIHLNGFSQKNLLMVTMAKLMRKGLVQKLTSLGADDPGSLGPTWGGRLARWCYARVDRVVGVSPAFLDGERLPEALRRKTVLIPNGVDLDRFRPLADGQERLELRRALDLPPDEPVVVFVGFCSQDKDPWTLWEAWRAVRRRRGGRLRLLFIGATASSYQEVDPQLAARLRRAIEEEGCGGQVRFIERTSEIERYLRASDLFVQTSRREGLPNALLEAMASGLPCAATRLPGLAGWLIEDGANGILFDPGDVEALGEALDRLCHDAPEAQRLGLAARRTIEQRFSIAQAAASYAELYRQVCGRTTGEHT
jgi:glycosyltransferase involved in cell wall biosynthesis